jgi:hypothetical protein
MQFGWSRFGEISHVQAGDAAAGGIGLVGQLARHKVDGFL